VVPYDFIDCDSLVVITNQRITINQIQFFPQFGNVESKSISIKPETYQLLEFDPKFPFRLECLSRQKFSIKIWRSDAPLISRNTDTGWLPLTLLNEWTNYDPSDTGIAAYRTIGDRVYLRGLLTAKPGVAIGQLPEGFRPSKREVFAAWSPTITSYLNIKIDGLIESNSTDYLSISGVSFIVS
jgi:hypothetical protein